MKIEELKSRLAKVEDPRGTDRENIRHKLEDIIIIGLCTLICDGDDFADMEEFGIQRQDVLSQFLELPNEIPDSDTFRGVFEQLNPEALSEYLYDCFPAAAKKVLLLQWTGKQSAVAATKVIKPIISKISLVCGTIFPYISIAFPKNCPCLLRKKKAMAASKNENIVCSRICLGCPRQKSGIAFALWGW